MTATPYDARLAALGRAVDVSDFPADFRWGLATAAYQIEGAATEGGRGPSIWDTLTHTKGLSHNGDTGDIACDHYHRWSSDFDLLERIGSARLSTFAVVDAPSAHGKRPAQRDGRGVLPRASSKGCATRGIRALVTLYHWDLPQALEDAGGWPARDTAVRFGEYAGAVVSRLGDLATDWITLNEPWCSSFLGYGTGAHAPGRTDYRSSGRCRTSPQPRPRARAFGRSEKSRPDASVGITNIVTDIVALYRIGGGRGSGDPPRRGKQSECSSTRCTSGSTPKPCARPWAPGASTRSSSTATSRSSRRRRTLPASITISGSSPGTTTTRHPFSVGERPAEPATTSFGWSVIPQSLSAVLEPSRGGVHDLPLYVTENGASFHDYVDPNGDVVDSERVAYLDGYLAAAADAIRVGSRPARVLRVVVPRQLRVGRGL